MIIYVVLTSYSSHCDKCKGFSGIGCYITANKEEAYSKIGVTKDCSIRVVEFEISSLIKNQTLKDVSQLKEKIDFLLEKLNGNV